MNEILDFCKYLSNVQTAVVRTSVSNFVDKCHMLWTTAPLDIEDNLHPGTPLINHIYNNTSL